MTKRHAQIQQHHMDAMSDGTLARQADLAEAYAHECPAQDLDGFFAAMRDAEALRAEIARRVA